MRTVVQGGALRTTGALAALGGRGGSGTVIEPRAAALTALAGCDQSACCACYLPEIKHK